MDHRLIQQIYTAGVEPARFEELLSSWEQKITGRCEPDEPSPLEVPEMVAHIRQAVAMFDQLGADPAPGDKRTDGPGADSPYPVMLCDVGGHVHRANAPARGRYGVAHVCELPFEAEAVAAIHRAVASRSRSPAAESAVILARGVSRQQPTVISVHPYRGEGGEQSGLVQLTSNELTWSDGVDDLLQRTFGLSAAECAVVQLMAEGAGVSQVAEQRGSSVATVRVQVRSVYEKTGVRSQPELLRLATGFVSLFNLTHEASGDGDAEATSAGCQPTADERHILALADGRHLDYADFGDPRGRPVLFLHDEYYGDCWAPDMIHRATAMGLRIVSPARPYYGRSDGYPQGVDATRQFAADVEALLERLGIGPFVVLARRTGFRFAVELAHRLSGRVAGLVALSPALPARSADDYRNMTKLARFISIAIFRNFPLAELACQAGIRYFRQMGPGKLARLLNKACVEDMAVVDDPGHWALISRGMAFSTANGHLGYLNDVRHNPSRAWKRTLTCPVHMRCMIGAKDPHDRLGRAQRCIDAGADLSVATVEGAGQLFFFPHCRHVLDEVHALWQRCATAD